MAVPFLSLCFCAALAAQDVPKPTLPAAIARMQANDPAGAAEILEKLVANEPGNGRAWRNLGQVSQQLKKYDRAIEAYRKALEVEPRMPAPMLPLASVYAARGDRDAAFEWLTRAKATRKLDLTQLEADPQFASLRGDARYKPLLPVEKDFEKPFVEPVRILREWRGEAAGDQFGWIARNIGDVDGDGVADVVTSAPNHDIPGAANAGRVYVYSTKSGKLLWTADGAAGNQLGLGIEAAGDTNGDGIPDVIASAPFGGYAKIYSGRDGRVLQTLRAEDPADRYGQHVAGIGDVDGDGCADVIVGAPRGAGRAYIYSGKTGKLLLKLEGEGEKDAFGSAVAGWSDGKRMLILVGAPGGGARHTGRVYVYDGLRATPKFTFDSDETGAALGAMFLAVLGDVDGDGVPDVFASDWPNRAKGISTGRVYVNSGKDGRRLFELTGENAGDGFGTSASVAGDVDRDGHADLIVGAWQYSGEAIGAGRAYLHSGKDGKLMRTFTARIPGEAFGFDAVTLGDTDGDGTDDFLITAAWSGVHGFHSGRVFVISSGVPKQSRTRK
jgi:tetratricopeptide (TPR) repeat protein